MFLAAIWKKLLEEIQKNYNKTLNIFQIQENNVVHKLDQGLQIKGSCKKNSLLEVLCLQLLIAQTALNLRGRNLKKISLKQTLRRDFFLFNTLY